MEVSVLKVLPQREAAIKGEPARSPREGGVTGASRTGVCICEFIPIKLLVAECEVHPEMMEGAAECPLRLQHGRKGEHEAPQLVHSHAGESQERGRAGLQASARSTSHRGASFPQRYHVR